MSELTERPIRVVIVDDHAGIRAALRYLFRIAEDIEIIAEGFSGSQAVELVSTMRPDVLLLDVELPIFKGDEVVRRLRALEVDVRILALSSYNEPMMITRMLASGAAGYILKDEVAQQLFTAIRFLVANRTETWLSPEVRRKLEGHLPS